MLLSNLEEDMKNTIANNIKEYFDIYYVGQKVEIKNYELISSLYLYLKFAKNKYATEETISRRWREMRSLLPEVEIDNKKYKLLKLRNLEYLLRKIDIGKHYDMWEFQKYEIL